MNHEIFYFYIFSISLLVLSPITNATEKEPTKNNNQSNGFLLSAEDFLRLSKLQKKSYIEALQDFMVRGDFGNNPEIKSSLFNLLIENAFAAKVGDECIFAGRFSKLVVLGKRLTCDKPPQGNCKHDQVQCNPLLFGDNVCVSAPFEKATLKCKENAKTIDAVIFNYADHASRENYATFISNIRLYCENPLPFNKVNCKELEQQIAAIKEERRKRENPLGGTK